jgi:hypothetical protein
MLSITLVWKKVKYFWIYFRFGEELARWFGISGYWVYVHFFTKNQESISNLSSISKKIIYLTHDFYFFWLQFSHFSIWYYFHYFFFNSVELWIHILFIMVKYFGWFSYYIYSIHFLFYIIKVDSIC